MTDEANTSSETPAETGAEAPNGYTFDQILDAVRPVKDPEVGLSIVDLGLIYGHDYDAEEQKLKIQMTLTSQMCPAGPEIIAGVRMMAQQLPGAREVEVELVWTPKWDPKLHCSDDAKAMLGIWD